MIADQDADPCLDIVVERFVAIGVSEIDGVVTGEDFLIDQPMGDFVMLQSRRSNIVQTDQPQGRTDEQNGRQQRQPAVGAQYPGVIQARAHSAVSLRRDDSDSGKIDANTRRSSGPMIFSRPRPVT